MLAVKMTAPHIDLTRQGGYVSANPGPTYAPKTFADHPDAEGCNKRALKSAMDTLFGRGEIVVRKHGKGQKERSHIERKAAGEVKKTVQRPFNARSTRGTTPSTTPRQPPANEGAIYTPYTPSVAPPPGGTGHAAMGGVK